MTGGKTFVRENGLSLTFGGRLVLALAGQSVAGLVEFNQQQVAAGQEAISYASYLVSSDFAVDVA